jgi:hypothetical protein
MKEFFAQIERKRNFEILKFLILFEMLDWTDLIKIRTSKMVKDKEVFHLICHFQKEFLIIWKVIQMRFFKLNKGIFENKLRNFIYFIMR